MRPKTLAAAAQLTLEGNSFDFLSGELSGWFLCRTRAGGPVAPAGAAGPGQR